MAIKSSGQITIVDVTDAYSVLLTSETYTFVGGTNGVAPGATCETEAVAYRGANQSTVVNVTAGDISCPPGISASVSNSGTARPKITFTTTATISEACEATIPVMVYGITVNKKFSFAVAKEGVPGEAGGQGEKGDNGADGADAITLTITSSDGTVFKTSTGSTILTAHVFVGGVEQTIAEDGSCGDLGTVKWYKGTASDGSAAKSVTVTAEEVENSTVYTCKLEN